MRKSEVGLSRTGRALETRYQNLELRGHREERVRETFCVGSARVEDRVRPPKQLELRNRGKRSLQRGCRDLEVIGDELEEAIIVVVCD